MDVEQLPSGHVQIQLGLFEPAEEKITGSTKILEGPERVPVDVALVHQIPLDRSQFGEERRQPGPGRPEVLVGRLGHSVLTGQGTSRVDDGGRPGRLERRGTFPVWPVDTVGALQAGEKLPLSASSSAANRSGWCLRSRAIAAAA
jgi:hypothetical protein